MHRAVQYLVPYPNMRSVRLSWQFEQTDEFHSTPSTKATTRKMYRVYLPCSDMGKDVPPCSLDSKHLFSAYFQKDSPWVRENWFACMWSALHNNLTDLTTGRLNPFSPRASTSVTNELYVAYRAEGNLGVVAIQLFSSREFEIWNWGTSWIRMLDWCDGESEVGEKYFYSVFFSSPAIIQFSPSLTIYVIVCLKGSVDGYLHKSGCLSSFHPPPPPPWGAVFLNPNSSDFLHRTILPCSLFAVSNTLSASLLLVPYRTCSLQNPESKSHTASPGPGRRTPDNVLCRSGYRCRLKLSQPDSNVAMSLINLWGKIFPNWVLGSCSRLDYSQSRGNEKGGRNWPLCNRIDLMIELKWMTDDC